MTENVSPAAQPDPAVPTPQELKGALKAFKKRLKVTLLDNESGKMAGPLSSGKTSSIVAITPPNQFRPEIWAELVKQGKLQYDGHGLYKLAPGA
ncbi:MAG: hypothetical protein HY291_10460 [Planctomycetes bacterium]|nr:hypothetical protein [Planctomycetota bacterium]